jgi:hypothetical protein
MAEGKKYQKASREGRTFSGSIKYRRCAMKKLHDLLPELGQILAHDFERFEITRMGILMDYARVFDKLLDVLALPYPAEESAVKVIEEFLASRQKPCGEWKSPDWLAYMLGQVVEGARKPKAKKPLAEDKIPF